VVDQLLVSPPFDLLALFASFSAGFRYFSERFLDQFLVAMPFSTFFSCLAYYSDYGSPPAFWRAGISFLISTFTAISIFLLDKRFKFTPWEKGGGSL